MKDIVVPPRCPLVRLSLLNPRRMLLYMNTKSLIITVLCATTWCLCPAQYTNCEYTQNLGPGNWIGNLDRQAELRISSSLSHSAGDTIAYNAPEVNFDNPFEIPASTTLEVYDQGCSRSCIESEKPCLSECESDFDESKTEQGLRYIADQIVLTFPEDLDVFTNPQDDVIRFNDTTIIMSELLKDFLIDPKLPGVSVLRRCLCGENIIFYENDNMFFDEGRVVQLNKSSGGVKEEGGAFALNYIFSLQETPFSNSPFTEAFNTRLLDKANRDAPTDVKTVAILDSGITPEYMADNSLYYEDTDSTQFSCFQDKLPDPAGWNFVDNNDQLNDERGHGTMVSLAYQHALQQLTKGELIPEQRLLTVKVLNQCGEGTMYDILCGLKYAKNKGASVINCSWGVYTPDQNLERVIEEITKDSEVMIVCSAGNAGGELRPDSHFPSGYAVDFTTFEDGEPSTELTSPPNPRVFEVGGLCTFVEPCIAQPINLPLTEFSNRRDVMFVESARGFEKIIPYPEWFQDRLECEIQGTSFAAPRLTGFLTTALILESRQLITAPELLESYGVRVHPKRDEYSMMSTRCSGF